MQKEKTETIIEEETSLATTSNETALSTDVWDYGDDGEDVPDPDLANDIIIPRLSILQSNSVVVEDEVEGAEPGLLRNGVTGEIVETRRFVLAKVKKSYNEWIKFDEGGGFVGSYSPSDPMVMAAKKAQPFGNIELPNGNLLKETVEIFTIPVDENNEPLEGFEVMEFTSAKLKVWKKLNYFLQTNTILNKEKRKVRPPEQSHVFVLSTIKEKGKKGTYFLPVIDHANGSAKDSMIPRSADAYQLARQLKDAVEAGAMKAQAPEDDSLPVTNGDSDEAPF